MTKAIVIHETGGPDVLKWQDVDVPEPGPGEARVRHGAVGLNYIDIYHRTGLYPLPGLPITIGLEAAGTVEAVGDGVTEVTPGMRVAYAGVPPGAYSEARVMPAHRLVELPESIDFETGAAMMLQGMTAGYLLNRTFAVKPGDTILLHAAAGGVGLIACQWAKHLGATVIGTVGSDEKAEVAKAHGCDHTINYRTENFTERTRALTDGVGVNVVYDSIGKDTFMGSIDCLKPMGMMVTYGNATGKVEPMDPAMLGAKGSLFLTRPSVINYTANRDDLLAIAASLFDVVGAGHVKIEINQRYALKDAAQAHTDLADRKTTGSTIFTV